MNTKLCTNYNKSILYLTVTIKLQQLLKLYMGYNNHKRLEREAATLDIKMASII